jgi:hypothetical protein
MNTETVTITINCVFQLGTPLREFAVITNTQTGRIAIVEVSEEVFDFLVSAAVPICEPASIPPGSLLHQTLLCLFTFDLGTEEPATYVVTEDNSSGEFSILQIPAEAFEFFQSIGIPVCPIIPA